MLHTGFLSVFKISFSADTDGAINTPTFSYDDEITLIGSANMDRRNFDYGIPGAPPRNINGTLSQGGKKVNLNDYMHRFFQYPLLQYYLE